eukprot:CAMPEP_0206498988 /NCGR_PEP_ID=MMETSP0324_2-20121206/51402_1 /ASSEMBLY_ACC=CAM_ASM_000836 /TAXON_ID=2866 /ORGANISM="Crypthecodinium cohnii, Strain Seligo" /LENGTH=38 /DNA_ID= /DNA_START= /DNA_END= /DNA_ORIENTATION=
MTSLPHGWIFRGDVRSPYLSTGPDATTKRHSGGITTLA